MSIIYGLYVIYFCQCFSSMQTFLPHDVIFVLHMVMFNHYFYARVYVHVRVRVPFVFFN